MATERETKEGSETVRSMVARWVVTGIMTLESAAHFGGEAKGFSDMQILRDPKDGVPLLPGTSLAGALRSYLADVLGGYCSKEQPEVAALFGAARGDDEGSQSPLIVFDSLGTLPSELNVEIRDGVAIDPATGTAEHHKKYDFEVLPAGTEFPVRVELIVGENDNEVRLVSLLVKALNGLSNGEIALGMRRSRGLGAIKANNWKARRFDLSCRDGWMQWLTSDHEMPITETSGADSPVVAVQNAYRDLMIEEIADYKRKSVFIDALLHVEGDILIRSAGFEPAGADVIHLRSAGKPVLPGTSLAGAMRSQALKIANLFKTKPDGKPDGKVWVDELFGPRINKDEDAKVENGKNSPKASRLRISEGTISEAEARRQIRIAIDRFTGGVVNGALFDEEVQSGGCVEVKIELRNPKKGEVGLLLLLIKDLLSGQIPVGGSVSVGRGILKGSAKIQFDDGGEYDIPTDLNVAEEARHKFDVYISSFVNGEEDAA
jgi:CRISPR/Cas system CSM-associated protein Csm3 (group 7 of RAMP superfamily)